MEIRHEWFKIVFRMQLFNRKPFHLILIFFGVWAIDLIINAINSGSPAFVPSIPFDEKIPFVPAFIYFYSIYFPLVVSPLFLLAREVRQLQRYIAGSVLVMIVSFVSFLLFPTKVVRVTIEPVSFAARLTLLYHHVVAPYNLLPSLHVSMLLLAFLSLYAYKKWQGALLAAPIGLSIASVVLTKQHYILDVLTAAPLAVFSFLFATRILKEQDARR